MGMPLREYRVSSRAEICDQLDAWNEMMQEAKKQNGE